MAVTRQRMATQAQGGGWRPEPDTPATDPGKADEIGRLYPWSPTLALQPSSARRGRTSLLNIVRLSTVSSWLIVAALAHHQEVAEAADMVVERLDLLDHIVGRAGEAEAGVDDVFDARSCAGRPAGRCAAGMRVRSGRLRRSRAISASARVAATDIAGRVGELRRDHARGAAVAEDLVGAPVAFLARGADARSSPYRRAGRASLRGPGSPRSCDRRHRSLECAPSRC